MKKLKRSILPLILLVTLCYALPLSAKVMPGAPEALLSPALQSISDSMDMAKWCVSQNSIPFSEEDFRRAQNLSALEYITVASVPKAELGSLTFGGVSVVAGQIISAESLSALVWTPAESQEVTVASFAFSCNGAPYTTECHLYQLSGQNYAPSVATVSEASTDLGTYTGISTYVTLRAHDPDADELRYEIVSYPKDGFIRQETAGAARLSYTPIGGFTGKDSFRYVAIDKYGNYSPAVTVSVEVSARKTNVEYLDLDGHEDESCAIAMTEAGIMSGSAIGNGYYFYPEQSVSRAEFVVMAMNAAGITEVAHVRDTGFADDALIPTAMKGYVAAAYRLDYIHGVTDGDELCFKPGDPITRAEAAYMLCRVLGAPTVTPTVEVFADSVPSWAEGEIYALEALGILSSLNGELCALSPLSRAQAARMLEAAIRLGD